MRSFLRGIIYRPIWMVTGIIGVWLHGLQPGTQEPSVFDEKICSYLSILSRKRQWKMRRKWFSFFYFKHNQSSCKNEAFYLASMQIRTPTALTHSLPFTISSPLENAAIKALSCPILIKFRFMRQFFPLLRSTGKIKLFNLGILGSGKMYTELF